MKKYKFRAGIEPGDRGGAFVRFPYDVAEAFGAKGKIPVKAFIDGEPYRGSLIKYGFPEHILGVPKAIREKIGKDPGDAVEVELSKDEEERTLETPPELHKRMLKEGLLPFFEKLSYTHRKEYCRWIAEAKKEETRQRRLEKAVELLKKGVKTPM
jgi:bifunctional DNA-binding transcriptional regulator/antitoxin component of YhaV-PrlF toxin-antitoxin module